MTGNNNLTNIKMHKIHKSWVNFIGKVILLDTPILNYNLKNPTI